ncbi:MAG TPA: TIGR03435 family protein [Acidobacteriaceae bacterium]
MRNRVGLRLISGLLAMCGTVFGQAASGGQAAAKNLTFDVATVRPAPPLDMAKLQADVQAGKMPNFGMHLDGLRAEYNYMSMKELVVAAYKVKPYQVTGPDWIATERYDIVARMPEGSKKEDAADMLKALLEERFKLQAHTASQERPVLALVAAKGGTKLKDSPAPEAIDETAPLKPGERKLDMPDGPARITQNIDPGKGMSAVVNMGARGTYTQKIDMATQVVQINGTGVSMSGFVDMLSQIMQIGGPASKPVVDETGLTGHYEVSLNLSLADLMAAARSQGLNMPGGNAGVPGGPTGEASDPGGAGSTVYASVEKLGLKLEPRKAPVQQLVVDSAEKAPTEN